MTGLDEAHPTRRNNERTVAGRHRMMRRADREVTDCEQIEGIVAACRIVHVGYADAEGLTIVPLNSDTNGSRIGTPAPATNWPD